MTISRYVVSDDPEGRCLKHAANLLSALRTYCQEVENVALLGSGGPDDDTDPGHLGARFTARLARDVIEVLDEVYVRIEANREPAQPFNAKAVDR